MKYFYALAGLLMFGVMALSEQKFSDLVGNPQVGKVKNAQPLEVPYLTWGGDEGFFYANGGETTQKGSIYDQEGLNLKFVKGDDFVEQTKRYIKGETPFIRGTMAQMGMASEICGKNPETTPVVILQLTWSAGDYIVARKDIKNLNDLKRDGRKVKIALQQGGPHPGLVHEVLEAVRLTKNDVDIVFVQDLTGPKGPADAFRKDPTIDACCVITPDMMGLTGGLTSVGNGAEGTVKDAHVLVSTQTMSRCIADVLCVRKDWYDNNKATCEKIAGGYIKACVTLVEQRKEFEKTKKMSMAYKNTLTQMQKIFGKDVLPTLEVDAHGMLMDATFVGLDGNVSFFEDKGNLSNFDRKQKAALDMAVQWGYTKDRNSMYTSGLDYQRIAKIAGLKYTPAHAVTGRIAESTDLFPDSELDNRTILSFVINFKANQNDFSVDQYGPDFDRAIKTASTFGNAVVVIRGHSDPTKTLVDLLKAGMDKGIITREGDKGNYSYKLNGKPLDLSQTKNIESLIKSGAFDGSKEASPRDTMEAAQSLSLARAEAVKKTLSEYAKSKNFNVDLSQIRPVGAGIAQPIVPRPRNIQDAEKNMRVEFRIVRVDAESLKPADFDY
jgi:ABC-type nitrate/sulfonate/bicarbonate transport system substrate-binding protein